MAFQPSVSNRLHRSGAIDFNVEFNTRQAQLHKQVEKQVGKRKLFEENNVDDVFSVCEGEPVYSFSSKRANFNGGCMSLRKPIQLLSSLNGYDIDDSAMTSPATVRNYVFKTVCPTGVSVTKWDFRMAGKQGDLFVATIGGLNTVYVDEDVVAGDVLVVDLPLSDNMPSDTFAFSNSNPTGFIEWQVKRGVPKTKKTLVVRAMPRVADNDAQRSLEEAFHNRGQVLGRCVKSAKKGERCDMVLTANAIGLNRYTAQ